MPPEGGSSSSALCDSLCSACDVVGSVDVGACYTERVWDDVQVGPCLKENVIPSIVDC